MAGSGRRYTAPGDFPDGTITPRTGAAPGRRRSNAQADRSQRVLTGAQNRSSTLDDGVITAGAPFRIRRVEFLGATLGQTHRHIAFERAQRRDR